MPIRLNCRSRSATPSRRYALDTRRPPPPWSCIHFAWAAREVGYADELDQQLACQKRQSKWTVATRAVVRGEYAGAAEMLAQIQTRLHEAYARLRAEEKRVMECRRPEADEQLDKALAFFRYVGAARYIAEAEALVSAPVEGRSSSGH